MSLKVSRILHAGYVFECEGTQIAFDPIFENPFSRNCHAFPQVEFDYDEIRKQKFSAVFISHYHDDHCSMESLHYLDRKTPIYMFCVHEEMFELLRQLGFRNVNSLQLDVPVEIGKIKITPRRALDADVDSLFQIQAAGVNVLNVVDSWIDYETLEKLKKQVPWDLVLWPFQTMRELAVLSPSRAEPASLELPTEWIEQLKALNPRYVVPSSCQFIQEPWSWYNHAMFPITYLQFQKEVEAALPEAKVIRLNPSVSIVLDRDSLKKSSPLTWVLPVGEQDVDYEFRDDIIPTSTAEIAKKFAPLTNEQTLTVYNYCKHGLIEKFNSMAPSEDLYFLKPRLWKLSVFDNVGDLKEFHFLLQDGKMQAAQAGSPMDLAWTTEVPVSKLYAALELGESLTSMYMRINDEVFSPAIEKELESADIVEDPLVRCLFHGAFGTYQKAQLNRIKAEKEKS